MEMDVRVQVHMNHRSQVDLMAKHQHLDGHAWDISMGGLAVEVETYIPRGTALEVSFDRLPIWGGEGPEEPTPITVLGRVQRCAMASHRPTYLLAVAFLEVGDRMRKATEDYVDAWCTSEATDTPEA